MADFPFKAVIFDMDGVLVDTELFYLKELRVFCDEHGLDVTDDFLCAQVGASHQAFVRMMQDWVGRLRGHEVSPDEALEFYGSWAEGRPCDYRKLLNPGVPETLESLSDRGVRLALASSSRMENIKQVLGECGLSDRFEIIVSGEQFKESKPEPDIYLHAIDLLGLPACVCCCVEDSVPGITAGKRAGLTVIAKREERFGFSQDDADVIIDSIPDLLNAAR